MLAIAFAKLGLFPNTPLSRRAVCTLMATPLVALAEDEEGGGNVHGCQERRLVRYSGVIESNALASLNGVLESLACESSEPIHLHIQSQGGELIPALYTADLIQSLSAPVITYVDGIAASAATLLSVSGHHRLITPHSVMLIHQLSTSHAGNFAQLEQQTENDRVLMEQIKSIYMRSFTNPVQVLNKLLATDRYLTADVCLDLGLVDSVQ